MKGGWTRGKVSVPVQVRPHKSDTEGWTRTPFPSLRVEVDRVYRFQGRDPRRRIVSRGRYRVPDPTNDTQVVEESKEDLRP